MFMIFQYRRWIRSLSNDELFALHLMPMTKSRIRIRIIENELIRRSIVGRNR